MEYKECYEKLKTVFEYWFEKGNYKVELSEQKQVKIIVPKFRNYDVSNVKNMIINWICEDLTFVLTGEKQNNEIIDVGFVVEKVEYE